MNTYTEVDSGHTTREEETVKMMKAQKRDEGVVRNKENSGKIDTDDPIEWVKDEVEEEEARVELGLISRIWTNRHINQSAFISTMKDI